MKRRDFLKKAGLGTAAVAATAANAPFVHAAKETIIKWRLPTFTGPALSAHVFKPAIDIERLFRKRCAELLMQRDN
jgi:hypothetical protein